jgi:replicative DNA helicase
VSQDGRLPPQSPDAERGLIGGLLRDNAAYSDVARMISVEHFYSDAHRKVFGVIADRCADGKPVDLVILHETLKARGQLDDAGGGAYLAELWDAAPTASNSEYYARMVREKSVARRVIHACTELIRDAYDGFPGDDLLERLGQAAASVAADHGAGWQSRTFREVLAAAMARIDKITSQQAAAGQLVGIHDLDLATGGFYGGELVTLGARPGVGKSALAGQIAVEVARGGRPVLFVTMEMSGEEVGIRSLLSKSRVSNRRVKRARLEPDDVRAIIRAADQLRDAPVIVSDARDQSIRQVAAQARSMARKGLGLVVIDYLQLLRPANPRLPRHEQVAEMTRSLKNLAGELDVPILLLSQLNRASDSADREPRLSDLKESGAIEQDSDIVLLMHRDTEFYQRAGALDVIVAKQRNGAVGRFKLSYHGETFRFEPWSPV